MARHLLGVINQGRYHPHRHRLHAYADIFVTANTILVSALRPQDMQDMYGEATGKGAKFLEAPVSGSKVRGPC